MTQSAKKINYMISDDVRKEFERLVPAGARSKVVNEALRKELIAIKRKRLTERLLSVRAKSISISTKEMVRAIKKDRLRNG